MSWLDFQLSGEEIEAENRVRQNAILAQRILEEKFADRGLRFTTGFEGAVPVQAYGEINGMRFYFRLRHGNASLDVGRRDLTIAEEMNNKQIQRLREKMNKFDDETDKRFFQGLIDYAESKVFSESDDEIPEIIVQRSEVDVSDQGLDGAMYEVDEFVNVFSQVVEELRNAD